jgi:hypothetical protein
MVVFPRSSAITAQQRQALCSTEVFSAVFESYGQDFAASRALLTSLMGMDCVAAIGGGSIALDLSGDLAAAERMQAVQARGLRAALAEAEPNKPMLAHVFSADGCIADRCDHRLQVEQCRADLAHVVESTSRRVMELPPGVSIDITNADSTLRSMFELCAPACAYSIARGRPWTHRHTPRRVLCTAVLR